ncbi:MAG: glycosyltransferase, partial [Tissierellia bacterium]|nr:glycosyltransferase [Tissierellia bacterium]
MGKDISVIIVTYNSETYIYDCLDSLFKNNDIDDRLEVIIVDNMSVHVNSMFETIKSRYKNRVTLIKNNKNGGYGQGNNVGINNSSAPIIMIMNPDVRLVAPIFRRAISFFEKDDTVDMLGMKQMISSSKKGISYDIDPDKNILCQIFLRRIANWSDIFNENIMFFSGACFFLRKKSFQKIGMFDENLFLYGEEYDIFCRYKKYIPNSKKVYVPNMVYLHLIDKRIETIEHIRMMHLSMLYVFNKFGLNVNDYIRREII